MTLFQVVIFLTIVVLLVYAADRGPARIGKVRLLVLAFALAGLGQSFVLTRFEDAPDPSAIGHRVFRIGVVTADSLVVAAHARLLSRGIAVRQLDTPRAALATSGRVDMLAASANQDDPGFVSPALAESVLATGTSIAYFLGTHPDSVTSLWFQDRLAVSVENAPVLQPLDGSAGMPRRTTRTVPRRGSQFDVSRVVALTPRGQRWDMSLAFPAGSWVDRFPNGRRDSLDTTAESCAFAVYKRPGWLDHSGRPLRGGILLVASDFLLADWRDIDDEGNGAALAALLGSLAPTLHLQVHVTPWPSTPPSRIQAVTHLRIVVQNHDRFLPALETTLLLALPREFLPISPPFDRPVPFGTRHFTWMRLPDITPGDSESVDVSIQRIAEGSFARLIDTTDNYQQEGYCILYHGGSVIWVTPFAVRCAVELVLTTDTIFGIENQSRSYVQPYHSGPVRLDPGS